MVYSGLALASVTVAVASAISTLLAPALGLLLSIGGVWLALRCRHQLLAHPELSGWGLSLTAIISSGTLLFTFGTVIAPFVMSALFLAIR